MKRFRAWGVTAALAAGAGMPAIAADPPAVPKQTTLANKLFGPSKPKPAGPTVRTGTAAPAMKPAPTPLTPEAVLDALRAEQDAYLRRLTTYGELRRVGSETNNDALVRQADELERQATALYNSRVAALGVPRVKAPLPDPTPSGLASAEFDPKAAANRLTTPAAPTATGGTAEVKAPATSPDGGVKP